MHRFFFKIVIAVAAAFTANPAHAIGPSFPCSKAAGRPIGELICASPDLSKLDLQFAQAYYALRDQVGPSGQQALEVQAINFENKAIADCQIPTSDPAPPLTPTISDCITREYEGQRQAWLAALTGPALEEANMPVERLLALQGDLQALGYLPATATIDGVYGTATRAAIESWQTAENETQSGFMGNSDASALEKLAAQRNVPQQFENQGNQQPTIRQDGGSGDEDNDSNSTPPAPAPSPPYGYSELMATASCIQDNITNYALQHPELGMLPPTNGGALQLANSFLAGTGGDIRQACVMGVQSYVGEERAINSW